LSARVQNNAVAIDDPSRLLGAGRAKAKLREKDAKYVLPEDVNK
jgi:hypothetical protein